MKHPYGLWNHYGKKRQLVTAGSFFDFSGVDHGHYSKTSAGSKRVPAYSVIKKN